MVTVMRVSAESIFSDARFDALADAYADETGHPLYATGFVVQREAYRLLDEKGLLYAYAVSVDGVLHGFGAVVKSESFHTGKPTAICDTIFVDAEGRKRGAGMALMSALRSAAKEIGAPALVVNARSGTKLDRIMSIAERRGLAEHVYNSYLLTGEL